MAIRHIDIHTHSRKADSLCLVSYSVGRDEIPARLEPPCSVGIHPWDASSLDDRRLARACQTIMTADIAAVGEAGLDFIKDGDRQRQEKVFILQLEIARERKLPVIVHCVKAYNELFGIIARYPELKFILHGYVGSPEQSRQAFELGCYLSIGALSFASPKTIRSIETAPLGRLFAETDESAIPISEIYSRLARIKGIEAGKLADAITDNYRKIFG